MSREVENLRGMKGVKHVHQIQVEILLEPNNIAIGTMKDLQLVSQHWDITKD
jgi:hypothetical protein